jgi:apolipoprotein N-acyltransferase
LVAVSSHRAEPIYTIVLQSGLVKHRILRVDRRLGAAALSGVLYALAQPEWGGWPLAAICLVPMLHAWYGGELGRRVWLAFVFGSIATGLTTIEAGTLGVMSYFGVSVWAAVPIAVAVGLLLGSGSFVLFAALSGDPRRHHAVVWSLRAGAALAASELIRSTLFGGLPWILFAYSLAPVPELAQSASLGGVYLVSFWLTSLNAALALAFNHAQRRGALVTAMLLCAAVYAAQLPSADGQRVPDATGLLPGEGALAEAGSVRPAGVVRIVSVQSGPRDTGQGAAGGSVAAMDRLAQLSRTEHAPDLAIWPENAVGALLPLNEPLIQRSLEKLSSATTHVIVGAPRADPRIP